MTKKMIWTLFAAAAAGITVYLVRNKRANASLEPEVDHIPGKKRRRMTPGFSKAKAYANGDDLAH
jgi:hypothetical protein